ncbi:hypothetical protein JG688_00004848 [Phytophthora aleatoria]|uniref:SWIM-type domain-containing protein n=1 Tax=Phytophthora aleatoria TaxID=2496075 RepID=A0A8J5M903_9STRA|nr:hypothetical protein JG688_00004848 [Phytophthora aleatoria]
MLAKLATYHACNLVEEQYRVSGQMTYETSNDVNDPGKSCSCAFYQTVLLPCRHIIALRRNSRDLRSTILYESVPAQWLLADKDEEPPSALETTQKFNIEDIETPHDRVHGHNETYRSSFAVCQRIAEVAAGKGSGEFRAWIDYLKMLEAVSDTRTCHQLPVLM